MEISTSIMICAAGLLVWLVFTLLEKSVQKKKQRNMNLQQGRGAPNGGQAYDRYNGNSHRNN